MNQILVKHLALFPLTSTAFLSNSIDKTVGKKKWRRSEKVHFGICLGLKINFDEKK